MTNNQLQVILTGVFGDGCLSPPRPTRQTKNYSYSTNCIHREYVEYKATLLGDLSGAISTSINMGYKKAPIYRLCTKSSPEISTIATNNLETNLNLLDDLGIALWFYDDGSFHQKSHFYNLCTHAFSKEEQLDLIIPFLNKRLNIKAKLRPERKKDGREFWYCAINKCAGAENISKILQQFPVECFKYKTGVDCTFTDGRTDRWLKQKLENYVIH